ncbi:MAG TPA: hypothetical protein VFE61_19350 [Candidatus Sulfotelmatobacter sp.]|nr:hypothetical protein [Candidatus Sulfotelmatobacter sp.]
MRVYFLALLVATVMPWSAVGDSCISVEGTILLNQCPSCMKVTTRKIEPSGEHAGNFIGEPRSVRVAAGARVALQDGERFAVTDISRCD